MKKHAVIYARSVRWNRGRAIAFRLNSSPAVDTRQSEAILSWPSSQTCIQVQRLTGLA